MCLFFCDDVLVFCNSAIVIASTYRQQLLQYHKVPVHLKWRAPSASRVTVAPPFGQGGNWKELRSSFLFEEEKKQGRKSQEKWLLMRESSSAKQEMEGESQYGEKEEEMEKRWNAG